MKNITCWILKIEKGYREITFRFDDITDAEGFLQAWISHKDSDDEYNKEADTYSIYPVFEQEEEEEEEDSRDS